MKSLIVFAGKKQGRLEAAADILVQTLTELGLSMTTHYFDPSDDSAYSKLEAEISDVRGLAVAFETTLTSPSSPMKAFLEWLSSLGEKGLLKEKMFLLLTTSDEFGQEVSSCEQTARILSLFEALEIQRIAIPMGYRIEDENTKVIIEKHAEDFYRILRQNRAFFMPQNTIQKNTSENETSFMPGIGALIGESPTLAELAARYKVHDTPEEGASQISKLFAAKLNALERGTQGDKSKAQTQAPAMARASYQQTKQIVKKLNKGAALGFTAVFQLCISGLETFEAHITVDGGKAVFADGNSSQADITIICDSGLWLDILSSKHSAQKAFMIGKLKVRGNFVLLAKFDELFLQS